MQLISLPFLFFLPFSSSLNILIFSAAIGQSHLYFLNSAVKILTNHGHNVDVVLDVYNEMVKINLDNSVRRIHLNRHEDPDYWKKNAVHFANIFEKTPTPWREYEHVYECGYQLFSMKNRELEQFLLDGQYDIGISSDYDPCGNILMKAAGIPSTASLIATPLLYKHFVSAGLPSVASVYATMMYPEHDGSFRDKLFNFLRLGFFHYVTYPKMMRQYDALVMEKYGPSFPKVAKIERDLDVVFANSNDFLENQHPLSQKIKYIGGMGVKEAKKLPEEFEKILSSGPSSSFVLFSFGTQVPTLKMPVEIRRNFVEAFKKFPNVTFLWKYDSLELDSELFEGVENIHRLEWLPQTELLHDKRVKVFISHMGLNSYLETSSAGVPVLAIPLFADQQNNAQNARDRQMGRLLDRDKLTAANIERNLRELLENPKYSKNARAISKMMREKPEKSEDVFLKWVEFAAANPGLHKVFELPGADLTPFYYYCGDVIVFLLSVVVGFLGLAVFLVNRLPVRLSSKKPKSD